MRSKVLVVSHERSGTHFLINTIARSFGYDPRQIDIVNRHGVVRWDDPASGRRWLEQYRGRFVPNIFKSHHAYPLLAPYLAELGSEFTVFYVHRDGRDVMTSFWVYFHKIGPGWGPKTATVGEFMRSMSVGRSTQFQATSRPITMLRRWAEHVEGWKANRHGLKVHYTTYESLHERHDQVIGEIADALREAPSSHERPGLAANTVLPWRGEIGTWRAFFSEADRAYFERHTRRLRKQLARPGGTRWPLRWRGFG